MKIFVFLCIVAVFCISFVHAETKIAVSGPESYHALPSSPPISYYYPRYYAGPDYQNAYYYHRIKGRHGHPNHSLHHSKISHNNHPYEYHSKNYCADPR